jgi:hypothetical protein
MSFVGTVKKKARGITKHISKITCLIIKHAVEKVIKCQI